MKKTRKRTSTKRSLRNTVNKVGKYVFSILKVLIFFSVLGTLSFPVLYMLKWLKSNNKSIKIYPKFEIVEILSNNDVSIPIVKDALRISKEILQKIK